MSAVAAVIAVFGGFLFVVVASFTGISTSSGEQFFNCQCDSAIGPDPSATQTSSQSPTPGATPCDSEGEWESSGVPTTNPYAEMTVAPGDTEVSDWHRDCLSAMSSAPLQTPATDKTNSGFAVECARELALARTGEPASAVSSAAAEMVREVIYEASVALTTGRCAVAAEGGGIAVPTAQSGHPQPGGSCVQTSDTSVIDLPGTIAGQGLCGQRVKLDAVSAGDLIFWDYRDHAPTRVGIAVDRTRVVTADPATGQFGLMEINSDSDVRVKRVLPGTES
ncbi:hypothetical protein [Nocardia cyriacigeorgica]|uniref:hypothetical protein n=1 Tax=Nocardia cyriacigeorgica TaxID=135487 RepID=UPI0018959C59|nr:hypothetical protein [Nocardia cyriacigeorgica]